MGCIQTLSGLQCAGHGLDITGIAYLVLFYSSLASASFVPSVYIIVGLGVILFPLFFVFLIVCTETVHERCMVQGVRE